MKAIADTLQAYYLIRGVVDKKRFQLEDIHLIAPSMKLKLSPVPEMDEVEDEKVLFHCLCPPNKNVHCHGEYCHSVDPH
jgi:hypothetical protein